ncbi:MAG: hypothetical protein EHM55_15995 [Acidobacteria bacterium]|nr:MAG: hypothetical protein EHM55_15995 [Acidobacteriota bacterium]
MIPRLVAGIVAFCCTVALHAQDKNPYKDVTGEVRLAALRHAQVWTPGDVASKDMRLGPQDGAGFQPEAVVTCDYIEKKQSGTPKFDCVIAPDDKIRVKFGEKNGEIYSEVAATRLLWALGFGADRVYPVKVICNGCPENPMKNHEKDTVTREVPAAVVERKMEGDEIDENEGWSWGELAFVDETSGGAPLAHRDALKLLAAMVQHTDTKPEQQRLVCLDRRQGRDPQNDGNCQHPFLIIQDVGKTFGKATLTNEDEKSAVNFEAWSRTPVWKDDDECVAQLSKSFTGSLEHPKISEAGRQFLSDLLAQLTDTQLRDLFTVARFTQRDSTRSIDDWVGVFKQKREEIASRRCSE